MIRFENVALSYGPKAVLRNVDLAIPAGAHVALSGPSGCGKTTVLTLAAGLCRPAAGTVRVEAKKIAYAFQEHRLLPWRTAAENVNLVLGDTAATMPRALHWLDLLGMADGADLLPAALSGGMRQRVNLARALAYDGDLLLLDEPLKELDPSRRDSVLALLREHASGRTLLMASHDREETEALAEQVLVYRDGQFLSL